MQPRLKWSGSEPRVLRIRHTLTTTATSQAKLSRHELENSDPSRERVRVSMQGLPRVDFRFKRPGAEDSASSHPKG